MFSKRDADDVGSLEEVFRSHEFGRATGAMGKGGVLAFAGYEEALFAKEFHRPLTAVPVRGVEGEAEHRQSTSGGGPEAAQVDEVEMPEQPLQETPSGGGAAPKAEHAEAPKPASTRRATRFWTVASVSALVALVAAGIMAGASHHPRSNVLAQGRHNTGRPHGGLQAPGAAPAGSTAPGGSLAAADGPAGLSPGTFTDGGPGAGTAPGGHVTLVGPATFTGTPVPPAASGNAPGAGDGAIASPPPAGGTNPVAPVGPAAPVASTVGNTVSAIGSSVTTATGQIASFVPATGPGVGVVNTLVNTLDPAAGASTG
jgi:hypothetical protein